MGVQKSRKSTKYTKYSLLKSKNTKKLGVNKTSMYLKFRFQKKDTYLLKNKSNNVSLFFDNIL